MRNMFHVFALLLLLSAQGANAESSPAYPQMPVHVIVPFPAGGPADILARTISQRLSEVWGQPVIIDNKPGANTALAAARVAKMPADGYSLFVVMDVTMVLNPLTTRDLPYDPVKDFSSISLLAKNTSLLTVRAADGPRTLKELVERGRRNAGALNFGAGIITTRLAAELFNREAGFKAQFVPFQGSPPTVQGLMTGSVDYIVDGAAASLPLIQAGQLRPLAKTNDGPVFALPELKSFAAELKAPTLEDISTWIALVAPQGTPRSVTDSIQRNIAKLYADPAFVEQLRKAGLNPVGSTAEELDTFIARETQRWAPVIKTVGIEMN